MTTQTIERTEEGVDLSDLDLLDDPHQHIFCVVCNGEGPGVKVAACGKRAMCKGIPMLGSTWPPNMCPTCIRDWLRPCPRCTAP